MNREAAWQRWLTAIGAERRGGELVAPCPLADLPGSAHREGGDPYKVVISPGAKRPVVLHCRCCGSERLYDILAAWGVSSGELQRLASDAGFGTEAEQQPQIEYDFDLLHRAYSELVRLCPLTAADREWLRRRGVSDALADYCGYGSLPHPASREAATARRECGRLHGVSRVPGLHSPLDLRGPGIAIPCRDAAGRIRAVKVRLTDGGRSRMRYLSSRYSGGLPAVSDLHFARGFCGDDGEAACVTEGERKADVVASRWRWQCVSVPGVGCVEKAVRHVVTCGRQIALLAFDADAAGSKATEAAVESLRRSSWRGELLRVVWGEGPKGIDDAITAGRQLQFVGIELGEPPSTSPHTERPRTLGEALGSRPWRVADFRRRHPQFNGELTQQIASGEAQSLRVVGVGLCVGATSLNEEEWRQWVANLSR